MDKSELLGKKANIESDISRLQEELQLIEELLSKEVHKDSFSHLRDISRPNLSGLKEITTPDIEVLRDLTRPPKLSEWPRFI